MMLGARTAAWGGKPLPYAKRVEYIRSSGRQYINTGWLPVAGASLKLRFAHHNLNGARQLGCMQNNKKPYYLWYWTNTGIIAFYFGNYPDATERQHYIFTPQGTFLINQEYELSYNGSTGEGSVDDLQFSGDICNSVPTVPFYLFARNNGVKADLFCEMSIYTFSAELDGEKLIDLIPVIDLDGNAKMFDNVSGTYPEHYGTFIPGPDKTT